MCKYQLAWSLHYALYVSTMFWYVTWSMKLYTLISYVLRKWNISSYKINVSVFNNTTSLWQHCHIIANVYTYVHTCVRPLELHCDVTIVAFGWLYLVENLVRHLTAIHIVTNWNAKYSCSLDQYIYVCMYVGT